MKPRWAAALVAATLVACAVAAARQAPVRPFAVGVILTERGDSTIEVVARFTGERWLNTWEGYGDFKAPVTPLDRIPDAWLGKPVPREWTAWSGDGSTRRVRVTGTARGGGCEGPTVLTLAQPGRLQPPRREIAIDADQQVEGFRDVARTDAEWAAVEPVALAAFRANERRPVAGYRGDYLLPLEALSREAMAGQPVAMAYLARPSSGTPAFYYFETFQPAKGRPSYGIRVAGWMRRGADGRWSTFGVAADVKSSESAPIPRASPLGIFRLSGHEYFLIGLTGYESWDTGIFEMGADGPRQILVTYGGGC